MLYYAKYGSYEGAYEIEKHPRAHLHFEFSLFIPIVLLISFL